MPKVLDYPLNPLSKVLDLSTLVCKYENGITKIDCAKALGKKISGSFHTLIGSAVKYHLITHKKSRLKPTQLAQKIITAHTQKNTMYYLQQCLETLPIYKTLFKKTVLKDITKSTLQKLVKKTYAVNNETCKKITRIMYKNTEFIQQHNPEFRKTPLKPTPPAISTDFTEQLLKPVIKASPYTLNINGPDIITELTINNHYDLTIMESILHKLKHQIR